MLGTEDRGCNIYSNSERGFRKIQNNKTIDSKSKYLFLVSDFNEIFFYRYRNRMHLHSAYYARRIFQEIEQNSEMFKSKSVKSWSIDSIFLFVKEKVANILSLIIFSKRYQ